ncbi:MAG: hypothetical protein H6873_03940 [Hyphomicrobiaceae bacterium]|nr:hypothetical protein [Hyphomicrobiaceae bacterium]
MSTIPCPFLVSLDQCGLELQGPNMRTRTKRLIPSNEVKAGGLSSDSLRYHAWDPDRVSLTYRDINPDAAYELEVAFVCERSMRRSMAVFAGTVELEPEIVLTPGEATIVRFAVPSSETGSGSLDIAIERRDGPDAVVSEVRLFSSRPVPPILTVVGDSRGGLAGTVGGRDFDGISGATVTVAWPGGELETTTDARGLFRVPLADDLPQGQHAELLITAVADGPTAACSINTRSLARGLRELPAEDDRMDLAGDWRFLPGRMPDPSAAEWTSAAKTRVPGHVVFDGLIPDEGVATLRKELQVPSGWAGDALFARFDGSYGRTEVFLNGKLAGVHSAGATSFDVDLTEFLAPDRNVLTLVITEYSPHAVIDYMSWYAHTSLLGVWREARLFHVPLTHLGPLDLRTDWDPDRIVGSIDLGVDIVNLDGAGQDYTLQLSLCDGDQLLSRITLSGAAGANGADRRMARLDAPDIEPWSAEIPRLYDLELVLSSGRDRKATYRRRVGFRRIETRGNQLLVNGQPIRVTGVNRHDARMRSGRSMRYEDLRADVLSLRHANVNLIRTAHYPADPRLLDLCDELGMYVENQNPICFAAGFDDHHWTRTNEAAHLVPYILEVAAETVGRDQGHASVLIWDLANETHWGWGFDALLELVREMDPSRPTIFSFDLNQLSYENPLPHLPVHLRTDIRTYHYPGWDRTWQEDIDWLRSYDQPCIVGECIPPFQDNARAELHAEMLMLDPGVRDFWVTGIAPVVDRMMQDRGCIGGMIWSAIDDQWILPVDETVGFGNWAHLTKLDYWRERDIHPPQDGMTFRGEGEWGLFDGWGRVRPELWHTQKMYSPISIVSAEFSTDGSRLDLTIKNRHCHRDLETLELRVSGARAVAGLVAAPGATATLSLDVTGETTQVSCAFWHPEGWLVDKFAWDVPGRMADPHARVLAKAGPSEVILGNDGSISATASISWLSDWPQFHVQIVHRPISQPVPLPEVDRQNAVVGPDGVISVPLTGNGWQGRLTGRTDGIRITFEYECAYSGDAAIDAREIGLCFDLSPSLTDIWWHRVADWTAYPAGHIGRPRGYAQSAPAPANPLKPAGKWELDTTEFGTNDYRGVKRSVLAAGATDGEHSVTVLSDGGQHVRISLINGAPRLHALDWYGGVPFTMDTDHIWTASFGTGKRIERGTLLKGKIVLVYGALPSDARESSNEFEGWMVERALA